MARTTHLSRLALAGLLTLANLACPVEGLDLTLGSKAQKQQWHEVIQLLQPKVDRREALPARQLLFLANAYAETRNYGRLFPACDLLQGRIDAGDRRMFTGDLAPIVHDLRAGALLDLGDPAGALAQAREAQRLLDEGGKDAFREFSTLETYGAMGIALAQLGRTAEAEACVPRLAAVDIGQTIEGPHKYAALARVHMALGQYGKALADVLDPKAEYHGIASIFYDKTFQKLPVAFTQAKCLFELGRYAEAREGYDALLKHPALPEIGGLHWQVLLDRARIARREGQDALAERLLRQAVDLIERQRASIETEAGRIGFVGDKQACYQELVALLADAARGPEAFAFVERAKGRALVDLLASQKALGRPEQGEALKAMDRAEAESQAIPDPTVPGTRGIAIAARQTLVSQAPELASLVSVPQVEAGALQARLGPDETLLEYYQAGPRWLALVVTPRDIKASWLPVQDLDAAVAAFRQALADPSRPWEGPAARLNRMLVAPVAAGLRTPKLILVPHGVLHYVPFCALGEDAGPLLERHSLRTLPSATVLGFLRPAKDRDRALILGDPDLGKAALSLPFAREEARALAAILPRPELHTGREATGGLLREAAGRFGIIHVAAHGTFDPAHPLDSALLLAPSDRYPGRVTVADLFRLDLDADLVALSACDTALSTVSRGDDVVGFTRGLLWAGCRSVLSSLWQVDDEATKDLMVRFYLDLATRDKAEALRQAQLAVRARQPHPHFWAAFTLTGRDR